MAITHGDATRNAMCDAVLAQINDGGAGLLRIIDSTAPGWTDYESGNVAADAVGDGTAASVVSGSSSGATPIAELQFSATAFTLANAPNPEDANVAGRIGVAHANTVTEDDDCTAGNADRFEIVSGAGNMVMRGTITVQSAATPGDILLTSVGIADQDTIAIRNLSYTCAP